MYTTVKKKLSEWLHQKITLRALGMAALLVALAVSAGPAWGAAIDVTLDNFSNNTAPHPLQQTAVGAAVSTQTSLSGVLGGSRETTLTVLSGPGLVSTQIGIGSGQLSFATPGSTDAWVSLDYTNVGSLDLLTSGTSSLDFNILSNDQGGLFGLRLWDGANDEATFITVVPGATGSRSFNIAGNTDFAGVNLANVTAIRFAFRGNTDEDLQLNGGLTLNDVNQPAASRRSRTGELGVVDGDGLGQRLLLAAAQSGGRSRMNPREVQYGLFPQRGEATAGSAA